MDYSYVTEPLIGALIGYSTNWIAIKMMFRPRKALMIGKIKIPFTPGIIPKNRENIAKTISGVIANNLLTKEEFEKTLLSDEMKEKIKSIINESVYIKKYTPKKIMVDNLGNERYDEIYNNVINRISNSIYNNMKEKDIGTIIAKQIQIAIEKKMSGSIIGVLGGNKIVQSIMGNIEEQINDYIDSSGQEIIEDFVKKEIDQCVSMEVSEIFECDIEDVLIKIYEKIIINKMSIILEKIELGKIIENKINSMELKELEVLILKVMKNELNAIVNLGAIIGFALGLFNLLF